MILADTSAWVEYIRGTGSAVNVRVRTALQARSLAITEIVTMEVLAGARAEEEAERLRRLLLRCELLAIDGASDFEHAAALYRACRRRGDTVRSMLDCLVAAVAVRTGARVLHQDRDYDVLARHTVLRLEAV